MSIVPKRFTRDWVGRVLVQIKHLTPMTPEPETGADEKPAKPKRELKFLLSIKPAETFEEFRERVIEALRLK